jgi:hypothetical protein
VIPAKSPMHSPTSELIPDAGFSKGSISDDNGVYQDRYFGISLTPKV